MSFLKDNYPLDSSCGYIPESIKEIIKIRDEECFCLSVRIGINIIANCHFYLTEEEHGQIEFDLDPREFQSSYGVERVMKFISGLGNLLQKDVFLTGENMEEFALLTYNFQNQAFSF